MTPPRPHCADCGAPATVRRITTLAGRPVAAWLCLPCIGEDRDPARAQERVELQVARMERAS